MTYDVFILWQYSLLFLFCLRVFFVDDHVHVEVAFISNTATFQGNPSIKTNVIHAFVKVILQIPSISV